MCFAGPSGRTAPPGSSRFSIAFSNSDWGSNTAPSSFEKPVDGGYQTVEFDVFSNARTDEDRQALESALNRPSIYDAVISLHLEAPADVRHRESSRRC